MTDLLYTIEEVAKLLKIHKNMVYKLIEKGYLASQNMKVSKFELIRFLEENNGMDFSDMDNVKPLVF